MRIPGRLKGFGRSDSKGKGGSSGKNVDVGALRDERRKVCSSVRSSRKASEARKRRGKVMIDQTHEIWPAMKPTATAAPMARAPLSMGLMVRWRERV